VGINKKDKNSGIIQSSLIKNQYHILIPFIVLLPFYIFVIILIQHNEASAQLSIADRSTYLADIVSLMKSEYPKNRTISIVCHGNSVPTGYFKTPFVDTFNAYPHLLHRGLKNHYPFAVINVITTGIGGESSDKGAKRFTEDVLSFHPDLVTIDYALTDPVIGLKKAEESWRSMIEACKKNGVKVILLTPTADKRAKLDDPGEWINKHARQIRKLAEEYNIGLVDSLSLFDQYIKEGGTLDELMSGINHPNRKGHELVANGLLKWFTLDRKEDP